MTMGATDVWLAYGGTVVCMTWDPQRAETPIRVDGVPTLFCTADAAYRLPVAVRLACRTAWPEVLDWSVTSPAWAALAYDGKPAPAASTPVFPTVTNVAWCQGDPTDTGWWFTVGGVADIVVSGLLEPDSDRDDVLEAIAQQLRVPAVREA